LGRFSPHSLERFRWIVGSLDRWELILSYKLRFKNLHSVSPSIHLNGVTPVL
jgi:hypothetical protein